MAGPARALCTYDEVDSDVFAPSERLALWRETGRLPMAAEPADAEARSGKTSLRNGQVGAAGVGQGEVLHSVAAHQHIAEAQAGRRDGELRLHSGAAEGDGAG